ncbi:MAG TPA: hypothetical protein VJN69_02160 [Candidatus Acidoferrales bacterium]|nr:hypothetical protein [Candidatus Acidoferrales bacterium]
MLKFVTSNDQGLLDPNLFANVAGDESCRASYEAAHKTERFPRQATIAGLPRSCGSSRCSTDA